MCSGDNCQNQHADRTTYSPVAAKATYNFSEDWKINAGTTWNQSERNFNNHNIGFSYIPNSQHIINLGYDYIRNANKLPGASLDTPDKNLKQTNISSYWQLDRNISLMDRWNYNWSSDHYQTYFGGIAYESCCWAVRFIGSRTFYGVSTNNTAKFDNSYYIQFSLKGLGNFGKNDPKSLLTSSIAGYSDNFGQDV